MNGIASNYDSKLLSSNHHGKYQSSGIGGNIQQVIAVSNIAGHANMSKYNWKTSTIDPPKVQSNNGPSSSNVYNTDKQGRPSSINKGVIGGGNFATIDPVELINYNNK